MTALRELLGGNRQVGVLLHLTALPGGTIGSAARTLDEISGNTTGDPLEVVGVRIR